MTIRKKNIIYYKKYIIIHILYIMIYDINSWAYQKYMKWNIGCSKPSNFNERSVNFLTLLSSFINLINLYFIKFGAY